MPLLIIVTIVTKLLVYSRCSDTWLSYIYAHLGCPRSIAHDPISADEGTGAQKGEANPGGCTARKRQSSDGSPWCSIQSLYFLMTFLVLSQAFQEASQSSEVSLTP